MNRKNLLSAAVVWLAVIATQPTIATAADWRDTIPEVRLSVRTNENAEGMSKWKAFGAYLEKELGQKVIMRPSADYAGTVEALRAKRLEVAVLGGAAYVEAWLATNGNIEPLAQPSREGTTGYYSTILVKADSPFKTVDDLKGHSIAFPDPNSTSGFQVPTYFLRKDGMDYRKFFSRSGFAGNHESAVMSVINGTYDSAATWYTNATRDNGTQMADKGLIPRGAMRSIWISPKIEENAYVVRKDLPEDFKVAVKNALLSMPKKAMDVLQGIGGYDDMVPSSHDMYAPLVEMIQDNLKARRQNN
jgi:phosphonate transport system substrate-binding protein